MTAWKSSICDSVDGLNSLDTRLRMLADPDGVLLRALGLCDEAEAAQQGLKRRMPIFQQLAQSGLRSKRFAMVVDGGVVKHLAIDDGRDQLCSTSAKATLAYLEQISPKRRRYEGELAAEEPQLEVGVPGFAVNLEELSAQAEELAAKAAFVASAFQSLFSTPQR